MAGVQRRILGILVISAGVCAALPFRNEAVKTPNGAYEAAGLPAESAAQNELTLQLTIPTTPVSAAVPYRERLQPLEQVGRGDLESPPVIASAFEPLVARLAEGTEAAKPAGNFDEPERLHRIADGDTLESLAERYLGDRSQWRMIFAANDEILTDRDILPIGKEIKIPQLANAMRDDSAAHLVPIPPGFFSAEQ